SNSTVSFAPGQTSQSIVINIIDDQVVEADETFTVNLSNPVGATITDGTGIGTIVNDDVAPPPELSINDVTVNEGDGTATFTVSLSSANDSEVTVDFNTVDGTAIAGSDYTGSNSTVSFAPGQTSQSIVINITDDQVVEADETFTVNLSNAVGATITDGTGVGTIVNDDVEVPTVENLFFSLDENQGVSVTPQDIVQFDGTNFSILFDGSDVFRVSGDDDDDDDDDGGSIEIDAFDVISYSQVYCNEFG
ncbi:Calx-beta domain-containing protein, partial [Crocosphaera sp. Alani8]|uniref:Calx-beta domain-containing protein n=1 Tax=Crocosphaera sp. Alani8 TaxID=3038952 RepID=UPI00313AC3C0